MNRSEYRILSQHEQHQYKPENYGVSDEIKDKSLFQKVLMMKLSSVIEEEVLEDGTRVRITILDKIADGALMDAIERPSVSKLKEIMGMAGELEKRKVEEERSDAQSMFKGVAIDVTGEGK